MKRAISMALSVFKYIIATIMMIEGVETVMLSTEHEHHSKLGFIYENHWTLVALGIIFFLSGLTLFVGKVKKWDRIIGYGLFAIYSCFMFGTAIQWYGYGFDQAWSNLVAAAITGILYLRWKYHIYYYQPLDKTKPVV